MIRPVLRMGHPLLREKAKPVSPEEITDGTLKSLTEDLFDTMEHEHGVGIAAPQIGVSKQVAIVSVPKKKNPRYKHLDQEDEQHLSPLVVINPKITVLKQNLQGFWEGCLSVPGLRGYVERPQKVRINFLDEEGGEQEMTAQGFLATVFQHELDHLDGTLYLDKVTDPTKIAYIEEYEKYQST